MAELIERARAALASTYEIDHVLGRGGMASVFLAQDVRHHRSVAIKVLDPELAAILGPDRFARAIHVAGGSQVTPVGSVIGTPAYMSPEQAVGNPDVDGRSDIYSLACVLYEMLAGQPPFTGATNEILVSQHLTVEPRPVTAL